MHLYKKRYICKYSGRSFKNASKGAQKWHRKHNYSPSNPSKPEVTSPVWRWPRSRRCCATQPAAFPSDHLRVLILLFRQYPISLSGAWARLWHLHGILKPGSDPIPPTGRQWPSMQKSKPFCNRHCLPCLASLAVAWVVDTVILRTSQVCQLLCQQLEWAKDFRTLGYLCCLEMYQSKFCELCTDLCCVSRRFVLGWAGT